MAFYYIEYIKYINFFQQESATEKKVQINPAVNEFLLLNPCNLCFGDTVSLFRYIIIFFFQPSVYLIFLLTQNCREHEF